MSIFYYFYQLFCLLKLHFSYQRPNCVHPQLLNLGLVVGSNILNQQSEGFLNPAPIQQRLDLYLIGDLIQEKQLIPAIYKGSVLGYASYLLRYVDVLHMYAFLGVN